jgi:hypothetical protein
MAGFGRLKDIIDQAYTGGKNWYSTFRKVPAIATTAQAWFDLSMAPGVPPPNYYLGDALTSQILSYKKGVYHPFLAKDELQVITNLYKRVGSNYVACVAGDHLLYTTLYRLSNGSYVACTAKFTYRDAVYYPYVAGDEFLYPLFQYYKGSYRVYVGLEKYLHIAQITLPGTSTTIAPAVFMLCDYLMYYPLIDMDNTDTQTMINSVTLPRYTDGVGVKAFLVATNPFTGGAQFNMTYIDSNGATKTSKVVYSNILGNIGTLVNVGNTATTSSGSPFLFLDLMDTGIKRVVDITFLASNGGLAALVLCKPLATIMVREPLAASETDFIKDTPSLPKMYDGAFLGFLCQPNGTAVTIPIIGDLTTIWN